MSRPLQGSHGGPPTAARRRRAALRFLAAGGSLALFLALGRRVARPAPTGADLAVRRFARRHHPRALSMLVAPLDPAGYPVAYIPVAHLCARWLRRRGLPYARAVAIASWAAWLAHRAVKLVYQRRRPPRGRRIKGPKPDSYPSGHTTGATGFTAVLAMVLRDEGLISREDAMALAIAVPLVVGCSRVYEDVHWGTDVAGGWLLGAAVAFSIGALTDLDRSRHSLSHSPEPSLVWRRSSTSVNAAAPPS